MTINIDNIDIYEVEKRDYEAYFYRLPPNEIIKTTPRPGLVIWKDIKENESSFRRKTKTPDGVNRIFNADWWYSGKFKYFGSDSGN